MKKKGALIFSLIGVLLVVAGVTFILLTTSKKSNKEVFTNSLESALSLNLDGVSDKAANKINEIKNAIKDNVYKLNVEMTSSMEEASSSKIHGSLYFGKGEAYGNIITNINDKSQNLEGIYKDNKLYFTEKESLSKYYYIDNLEEMIPTNDFTGEFAKYEGVIQKVLNYLKDSLLDSIKEDEIEKTDEEITVNSKDYKATKYEYKFTGENLYNAIESFLNKIKNDKDIINTLNSLIESIKGKVKESFSQYDEVELEESDIPDFNNILNQILESAKETKTLGELLTVSVYTYKDETIRTRISINAESNGQKIPMNITFDTFKENDLTYRKISLSQAGIEAGSIVINQTSKTNYDIKVVVMMTEMLTGKITIDGDNYNLKLNSSENLPTSFSLELNIIKDGGYIELESEGSKLRIDFIYEIVSDIPNIDLSNSASYTEMTEEEKEALSEMFSFPGFGYSDDSHAIIDFENDSNYDWASFDELEENEDLDF